VLLPEAAFGAGNVTVVEEEGNIIIRGDRRANAVVIDVTTVSGEDGTTINGGSDPVEIPSDGGFDIDLKDGDNFLDLRDVHRTFLHIQMGEGNDVLVFADAGASGECTVAMGKGDNGVSANSSGSSSTVSVIPPCPLGGVCFPTTTSVRLQRW
jgi:hypothetical protein